MKLLQGCAEFRKACRFNDAYFQVMVIKAHFSNSCIADSDWIHHIYKSVDLAISSTDAKWGVFGSRRVIQVLIGTLMIEWIIGFKVATVLFELFQAF